MIVQPVVDAYNVVSGWVTAFNAALNPYTNWYFTRLHGLLPEPFFNTQAFLIFFAAIFCAYWLVPRRWQMTRIWLLDPRQLPLLRRRGARTSPSWSRRPRWPTTSSAG